MFLIGHSFITSSNIKITLFQCKDERKPFVCELYVRAITAGMNELERLKLKTEKQSEARLTEGTLSTWFVQLGSLLSSSCRLSCECILTAFSIHPSPYMYEMVKAAPQLAPVHKDVHEPRIDTNSEFGSWATDSRTQTNLVKTSETINLKQTQKQTNVLSTAIFAEGEALGLGAELCQDLAVLISGPRVKTLSCDMDRETLLESCRTYMERTHGGTRALTTELKYLNLDPRSFLHLPEEVDDENDAFYGIEKGYEHLVELQEPEEIWQDAISDDQSQTDSAHSIEEIPIVIPRRKKKSKRLKFSTGDETDPLSLPETEITENKERPHSKERSKERKDKYMMKDYLSKYVNQSTELEQITEEKIKEIQKKEKKKERKERRKKEKADILQFETKQQKSSNGSLSRFVGMKVARIPEVNKQLTGDIDTNINNNLCVTDSDYDSQGKSSITSINSEGNDPNVLFDGLFSMDEIKSPDKTPDHIQRLNKLKIDELKVSNNIIALGSPKIRQAATQQQQLNIQSIKSDSSAVQFPSENDVREDVKKSIKKLIEFRRHKSINEISPTSMSNLHQKVMPDNAPTCKNVTSYNSPNSYLNNKVEEVDALKAELNVGLKNSNNEGLAQRSTYANELNKKNINVNSNTSDEHKKPINSDSTQVCSGTLVKSYQQLVNETNSNPSYLQLEKTVKTSVVKNIETPSQIQYKEFLKQRSFIKTHPLVKNVTDTSSQKQLPNFSKNQHSRQVCKSQDKLSGNTSLSSSENIQQNIPKQPTTNISETLYINTDYGNNPLDPSTSSPKELQNITNADVSPTENHFESFLKELQETINAGASKEKPNVKLLPNKTNCPKQKKVNKAPNTFSRLSYLHKNKHNDNKHKIVADPAKGQKNKTSEHKQNLGINLNKISHLQTKGEIHVSRIDKAKSNTTDNTKHVQKAQNFKCSPSTKNTPLCLNRQYPIMSNMLTSESPYSSNILNEADKSFEQKNIAPVASLKGHLTENDQKDLLLLLRQQSKMHPLKLQHKTDEVQKKSVNCATTINMKIQSNVKSNYKDTRPKDSHNEIRNVPILEKSNSIATASSSIKVSNNKASNSASDLKKVRNVKGSSKGSSSKHTLKNNDSQTSDWESVMNALLAQKTPSRGPNALDIVLKKDSFEKRSPQNVESQNIKEGCTKNNSSRTVTEYINPKQCPVKPNSTLASSEKTVQMDRLLSPYTKQKQDKKLCSHHKNINLSRNSPLDFNEKHLPDVIQNTNDPFISGIPNSDYDLLEELMDDDLRKEIGELMSDEEAYNAITQSPKTINVPNTKTANSSVNKYPNYKVDMSAIRKPQRVDSCQNLDLPQNKNVILPPKPRKDLKSKCNNQNKSVSHTKCTSSTDNNLNKKAHITVNELITSTILKQPPNSKICSSIHPVNDFFTSEKNNLITSSCNKNKGNNITLTSVCNKPKAEEVAVTDVQKNYTDNAPNTQNQILDPSRVILTVPQRSSTPNMVVLGSDLIYNPYSTIQIENSNIQTSTNITTNAYVPVNNAPNLTLFTTQIVNPVIIDRAVTLPVIRRVSPNVLMNFNSNMPINSNCSETEHYTTSIKPHQENNIKTEETRPNCNNKIENNIKVTKICEDNKSPVSLQEIRGGLPCNISASSNNKLIADTMHTKGHVEKIYIEELMQPLHQNITHNINLDAKEINRPFEQANQVNMKIPAERQENKSIFNLKGTEHGIKNPIKNPVDGNKYETDRERVQRKRMEILNRQLYHRCYDKPIPLSYKSIIPNKDIIRLDENVHGKIDEKTDCSIEPNTLVKQAKSQDKFENISVNDIAKINDRLVSPCRRILLRSSNVLKDVKILPSTKEAQIQRKKPKRKIKCQTIIETQTPIVMNKTSSSFENQIRTKAEVLENNKSNFETSINTNECYVENKNENCIDKSNYTCFDIEQQITTAIIPNTLNEMHNKYTESVILKENITETNQTHLLIQNKVEKCSSSSEWNDTCDDINKKGDKKTNLKEHGQNTTTSVNSIENKEVRDSDVSKCDMNDRVFYINDLKTKPCSGSSDIQNSKILSSAIEDKTTDVHDKFGIIDNILSESNLDVQKPMSNEHCPGTLPKSVLEEGNSSIQNTEMLSSVIKDKITNVDGNTGNIRPEISDTQLGKTIHENLLEYKEKVIIEEIPSYNNDPLKKCVRIKLPNGNTFKATISGKLSVNVDSLFEDPKIKALLWQKINNNTKCTLNIKQVAIKTPHKSHTIKTKVHDISYMRRPVVNSETINLISDDEDSTQTFKTEFGSFDIAFMNTNVFNKHQKRLAQKCVVEIERLLPIVSKAKNESTTELKSKALEVPDSLSQNAHRCLSASIKEHISDFIEIDDSSNESDIIVHNKNVNSRKPNENVDYLKKNILQDFVHQNQTSKEYTDNRCKEVSRSIGNSLKETVTISKSEENKSEECDEIQKKVCFVSLVRCDDTLKYLTKKIDLLPNSSFEEKSEMLRDSLDKKPILLEGHNKESTLKRSGSLSILNEFLVSNENKILQSPLDDNYDLINDSLFVNSTFVGKSSSISRCDADWYMTKFDIRSCDNIFVENKSKSENENLKYDDVSTDCDSDIDTSLSLIVPIVKDTDASSSIPIMFNVPTLNKLTLNYFVNNSNIIKYLKPYSCLKHSDDKSIYTSPLKRKSTDNADKVNRLKISKIENVISSNPILDEIDKKLLPRANDNTQSILLCQSQESINNFVDDFSAECNNFVKSKESQEKNNCVEIVTKINKVNIRGDGKPDRANEASIRFEQVVNGQEEITNESIYKTKNEEFENETSFCNENINEQSDCDDKIEVLIPLEDIDDKCIQSLTADSKDDLNMQVKTTETFSNNTHDEISKSEERIEESNCTEKYDSESLKSNKATENNDKNDIVLGHIENLQKQIRQDLLNNENTEKTNEEIKELKYKNVSDKEEGKNIMDSDHTSHNLSSVNDSNHSDLDTKSSNDNSVQQNVTLVYKGESNVVLTGSVYEDPVVGTCYVFPILNRASYSDEMDYNNFCDENTINVIQALKNKVLEDEKIESDERENCNNFNVIIPKITYSRQRIKEVKAAVKLSKKNLKRKSDMSDHKKLSEKRYRKSKNIDYPKITVTAMAESAYSKEYKRLLNYCSSIKFSFSQSFHKEYIDVSSVLKSWPIKECTNKISDKTDYKNVLFSDENTDNKTPYDPLQQTLAEEISSKYEEQQSSFDQISETNFCMGFGEESGRVKKITEDGDNINNISKFSAATLSDVKHSQPSLLSEDYDDSNKCKDICMSNKDQFENVKRFVSYVQLRDKVRSFFKKNTLELNYNWLKDNYKNKYKKSAYNCVDRSVFPYDLISPDFIEPAPLETVVQVVQVGQLPVSAAAQNLVTCDPRVTQVTDASPSQCSVENSLHDDSQTTIKTEYTELTTADLSLPLSQEYERHISSHESLKVAICNENIPVQMEVTTEIKIEDMSDIKDEPIDYNDNDDLQSLVDNHINNVDYTYDSNVNTSTLEARSTMTFESLHKSDSEFIDQPSHHITNQDQQNGFVEKTDQIAHAMNAAGIATTSELISNQITDTEVNITPEKVDSSSPVPQPNNYPKSSIDAVSLQQALTQILPPPLNQTNSQDNIQVAPNSSATSQVLHLVQDKNTNGNQITSVDNAQNSVINNSNTSVLHIVPNKGVNNNSTSDTNTGQHSTPYGGLSLVDAGLQQGNNQLLHIVNTSNQKNSTTGQLLKRVNLLTNLTNVQGSNEQKMVQFLCKAADGKSIQFNNQHQRGMVLRLQPIETSNIQANNKTDCQDFSPSSNTNISTSNKETANVQHEIKSRSVYEENYAKFIQSSSNKSVPEKSTSLPKFNQAFGKQVFQDNNQKSNDIDSDTSHLTSVNINTESSDCQSSDNTLNLDHIGQINSPPLLLRKPSLTTSTQPNLIQHIKQTISPMNIQTMHGGVIYTRQIPVNIGGGQTINLITVPTTELLDESNQKQHNDVKFINQNEMESPIIKIVPQTQTSSSDVTSDESVNNSSSSESTQNTSSQHQPVLTQMRIKLPMLSKAPQIISGTRVVRPSFFQIQRNVIGGANQPVYQQLVLTAAPPLGQHTIRLPQAQTTRHIKVTSDSPSSSESQMSSSTLEQLREFDMVLEQVKERSTVQPNSNVNSGYTKSHTQTSDTTENTSITSTVTESTQQVLYSIGSNQSVNVAYVSRKPNATTITQSAFARSPDSTGIIESPSSSTSQVQIPHTVTSESTSAGEGTSQSIQQKATKVNSKSKSRPKSSHPSKSLNLNTTPPKPSTQKPLEDEQTTQRILYILAEYKEQVENSPDKDKPAPRRRTNPPLNPTGSSKRKKSSSSSRRPGARDISPVHGDETSRTMGSEDSSCGTSQGDCTENCLESQSPQGSPRKVVRKLSFENEPPRAKAQPQRNVIVADGQTITVARGTTGKPTTAVLMPANYILPVSMVKGGQQIAIVTNRGPKLLTVGGDGVTTNALLLQRLIGPGGLKPVLTRPGVRHVRLPTAALHNLQAFNLATATTVHPPESTVTSASTSTPPELIATRTSSSPWTDRESQDIKPERGSSPDGSEPWNLSSSAEPQDYSYEETVRTDNMDRTVLDAIPDRYSPEMEAQRIFDKMFDVDSRKSYIIDSQDDSPRCAYDIDASDSDDKPYHQVVQRRDGSQRQRRLTHVSAAALRHKYAILEHELRLQGTAFLQKSLSEECEDLGVDSPSAAELFPEAELMFSGSPAHDAQQHSHTPQPTILNQDCINQPEIEDQIASDRLIGLRHEFIDDQQDLGVTLGLDEGIVTVTEDGMHGAFELDHEEFARSHPNTTFHSEPTDEGEMQPFTITGLKGHHITSTIFHAGRAPATVLVTAPQTTVISQATPDHVIHNNVKYANINHIINSSPATQRNPHIGSVLVKDDGLTRFDGILTDSRELHLSNTASAIVHSTGNATQVIRRVCYEDDKRDTRYLMDEPEGLIAGNDAKMVAEDNSRDATLESIAGDVDDDNSLPERHAELFWESNSASERSESRRPLDFSSDSEKCCKSPSYDETNSTDSSGVGPHVRLDSVIKDARGLERSGSADGSSADDMHPPLRTYPAKRMYHTTDGEMERSISGKTRAVYPEERSDSLEIRRRASGRGVVKRGCPCCNGSPVPSRPKKPRQRKPTMDFTSN